MNSLVFPGQGSQYVGMGKDLFDSFPEVKVVFEEVNNALDQNLSSLIFNGPDDELTLTENAQPAIMTVGIAIIEILNSRGFTVNRIANISAGHSLGEYSSLTALNSLSLADTAKLLKLRGKAMQNSFLSGEGSMAAILGLNINDIDETINRSEIKNVCQIANDNAPGQVVISLAKENFDYISEQLKSFGAKKTIPLNVSSGFHSSFMRKAEKEMIHKLENLDINDSEYTIVSNYNVQPVRKKNEIIDNLKKQITNRVRWVETIKYFESKNVNTIIEIGPNKILNGLNKRISSNFTLINVSNINELENLKNVI